MKEDQDHFSRRGLERLQARLGHDFVDPSLLRLALTHSSTTNSPKSVGRSNERLEFLGDRVLGLAVADMLYKAFPDEDEGSMARRHAVLVGRETLARVAKSLGLGDSVFMSQGEIDGGGRRNRSLLANTCEAIIGAMYLDAGFETAARFVDRNLRSLMDRQTAPPIDAKTELQEWAQARGLGPPQYREILREGAPHAPIFSVEVRVNDMLVVTAKGSSKRAAEKQAAELLLGQLRAEETHR